MPSSVDGGQCVAGVFGATILVAERQTSCGSGLFSALLGKPAVAPGEKDDILRDQLLRTESTRFSKDELEHGLRCVLYEMVVLALALVQLKNSGKKLRDQTSDEELPFGEEQTAHEAASLTCRLLIEFLYPDVKKPKEEDTSTPEELRKLHKSLHKWAAHLTWKRVEKSEKDYPQPYPNKLLKHGPVILDEATAFVDECIKCDYKLTSPNAKPYDPIPLW